MYQTGVPRTIITTENAPDAIGPYSQALRVGNMLFVSGQIGLDPLTGQLAAGGIEAETRQIFQNIEAILQAAAFHLKDVAQVQVFMIDLAEFDRMNAVYTSFLRDSLPARATVQVSRLPKDARVEIMVTAVKSNSAAGG